MTLEIELQFKVLQISVQNEDEQAASRPGRFTQKQRVFIFSNGTGGWEDFTADFLVTQKKRIPCS
jgi:hypothetical protein